MGENEITPNSDGETKPVELDAGRIRAIEILLRKTLPDLNATDITSGGESIGSIVRTLVKASSEA